MTMNASPPPQSLPLPGLSPQADTTQTDTTQADTTQASTDSVSAVRFEDISRDIGEIINLLIQGQWGDASDALYGNFILRLGDFISVGLKALLVFIVLYSIYWTLDSAVSRLLRHSKRMDTGLQNLLIRTFRVVAWVFILAVVLSQIGVNVAALVAGLSIAGIAVGFAARDSLENFISGLTILMDEPFKVGHFIVIDGEYGEVMEITLRSTRIRTVRNEIMVLPNTYMITNKITNHSKQNTLRVDIPFGIAYKEFPDEARQILVKLSKEDDRILDRPGPTVIVTGMNASSVDMSLRFYLKDASMEVPVRWEYMEKIREALREADIEIPFPHLQLFIDEAKALQESFLMKPELQLKAPSNGSGTSASQESSGRATGDGSTGDTPANDASQSNT